MCVSVSQEMKTGESIPATLSQLTAAVTSLATGAGVQGETRGPHLFYMKVKALDCFPGRKDGKEGKAQPYTLTLISFSYLSPSPSTPCTVPILQFCLSLLIFKSMFKGVSHCIFAVGILYCGLFNPFHYSSLPLYLPSPTFQQLSVHIQYLHRCYVLQCC
jgi:hypothetical protein